MTDNDRQIERNAEELKHLQEEIDEVRHRTPDFQMEHEPHFLDSGARDDGLEDNTIVPPG